MVELVAKEGKRSGSKRSGKAGAKREPRRNEKVPLLIIGAGPVGLALATDLGWRGVRCMVVEQHDGTVVHPRANTVNSRSMEFCRRWGIAGRVRESGAPADFPSDIVYVTGLRGHEIARITRPLHGGTEPLPTTPERSQRCNQLWFDPILRERAAGFSSVSLSYQTRLDGCEQHADHVVARLTDLESGDAFEVECEYLVSCCGGHGPVPALLGSRMEGTQVLSCHLNVFLRIPALWEHHDKGKAAFYYFITPAGMRTNLIELNGNDLWRLSINNGQERIDAESVDVDALVRECIGPDVPYEIVSALPWTCRSLVADKWGEGRVWLAGDAVHQHGPQGGFGMNTGLGDAVDLGWKLAARVKGWGGQGLLEHYPTERRPVAVRNVGEATDNMSRSFDPEALAGIADDTDEGAALRAKLGEEILATRRKQFLSEGIALGYRYDSSPLVAPDGTPAPEDSVSTYVQTARPGSRAPHALLADGRSTLDLFGRGFTLLCFGAHAAAQAGGLVAAARRRGMPLAVERIDQPEIAELYEARFALVRPDGHVAWRGMSPPENAAVLVDRMRGAA